MPDFGFSEWLHSLERLRDEFAQSGKHHTGPRVCWFYFDTKHTTTGREVEQFLVSFTPQGTAALFQTNYADTPSWFWCALFGSTDDVCDHFRRLGEQVADLLGPRPATIERLNELLPREFLSITSSGPTTPLYMQWVCAAAVIAHRDPDVMLAMERLEPDPRRPSRWQPDPNAISPVKGWHCSWPLCMDEVNRPIPYLTTVWHQPVGYEGPPVYAWAFKQDVWRVSVTALDKLLVAVGRGAPPSDKPTGKRGRRREYDSKTDRRIWEARRQGQSYADIGREFDITETDVGRAIDRHRKREERAKS